MLRIIRQRDFGLLFAGQFVSQAGDYVLLLALPIWIYQLTGSAAATGGVFMALTLPQLVLSPIAGVFVDRWNHKTTMIVSDLARAAIVCGLFAVRSADQVWLIFILAFLQSSVSRFFFPARTAALPAIVPSEQLTRANAALSFSDAVARLGGPAVGGVLVAVSGAYGAVAVDAASYLVSAALLAGVRVPVRQAARRAARGLGATIGSVGRDLRHGVEVVAGRPALRAVFGMATLLSLAQGVINVLMVVLVTAVWDGGPAELGWLTSARAIGALAGGPVVAALASRMEPKTMLVLASAGSGCLLLAMVNQPSLYAALPLFAVIGVLVVALQVGTMTILQIGSEPHTRGRVSSLLSTSGAAATLLAMGVTGAFADQLGAVRLLDLAALAFVLGGLIVLMASGARAPSRFAEPGSSLS